MKVYIAPYENRWVSQVHDRHMSIKYGPASNEQSTDLEDRAWECFEKALQWLYNHTINLYLDAKERKIKVKIHYYDTWSMDDTLAHIIHPMLKQLKETMHGSPLVDDKDVPEELRSTSAPPKKNEYDTDDNHHKRWEWVIDEMIWAFEQKLTYWEEQYTTGDYDWQFKKTEEGAFKGYSTLIKGPNHTAETDWDAREAHQKRMSRGFALFGKYYEALWD